MSIWSYFRPSLSIVEIWWGISIGIFESICIKAACPIPTSAISWFPSPTCIRINKTHTMWWQVLQFAICNELQSQKNWLLITTVYLVPPCFITTSVQLLFCDNLEMHTSFFISFTFFRIFFHDADSIVLRLFLFDFGRYDGLVCCSWGCELFAGALPRLNFR